MEPKKCPNCGIWNADNWPITVNHEVVDGGCQNCWETEIDTKWWGYITGEYLN